MDLSGAEYLIAVLAAFYLGRSYTVLALSFRSALGCRGQNHPRLDLSAIWTFNVCPRLYPSSARALSPKAKWAGVTSSLAPHCLFDNMFWMDEITISAKKITLIDYQQQIVF